MQKVRTFLHVFVNSLLPLDSYYKKLHTTAFTFSVKYFTALIFIVSLFSVLAVSVRTFYLNSRIDDVAAASIKTIQNYPQDLYIKIVDGRLLTNYDKPFIAWFEYKGIPHPILVIDPLATPSKIDQYDTPILLTQDTAVVRFGDTIRIMRFNQNMNVTITQQSMLELQSFVEQLFAALPSIVTVFILLGSVIFFLIVFVYKAIYLALLALVIFILARFFFKSLQYLKTYQIALHASTTPILLEFLTSLLRVQIQIPYWVVLLHVLFLSAALYETYAAPKNKKKKK
ncbi:MAG: DUF1189 family protein [Candidatus Paceibacterota bacterium]